MLDFFYPTYFLLFVHCSSVLYQLTTADIACIVDDPTLPSSVASSQTGKYRGSHSLKQVTLHCCSSCVLALRL